MMNDNLAKLNLSVEVCELSRKKEKLVHEFLESQGTKMDDDSIKRIKNRALRQRISQLNSQGFTVYVNRKYIVD